MTHMIDGPTGEPLDRPGALPLLPPRSVESMGPTLVVAPHPDDETLACGGLIALLSAACAPVRIAVVSDGCGSHPGSRTYPPDALRSLRESETRAAAVELGLDESAIRFLRLPDTRVPHCGEIGFGAAVDRFCAVLAEGVLPETVLLPWRRDPHADHRATWQIVHAAFAEMESWPRMIEYPIWVWDLGQPADAPRSGEMRAWRLDIAPVLPRKLAAISCHQSQTTGLITDGREGFCLTPEVLERFRRPWEIFLEPVDA